jgi:Ca2+-binding RTX toxin-like protein
MQPGDETTMGRPDLNFSLLTDADTPSSPPGIVNHALLEDELGGASGLNFSNFTLDPPNAFGLSVSDYSHTFNSSNSNGSNSNLALYSSDVNVPPGHAPEVVMAAGGPPGSSGGGTTTSGSTLVSSSGLSINITWDSSVSSAPLEFKNVVLSVAQYFVDHFTDHVTLNINVGYGEAGGNSLGSALGMSLTYLQSSSYSQIKAALITDAHTAEDNSAVASLLGDPTNGGNFWMSTAEAKALGLNTSTTNTDGFVGFSSTSGIFDYNNTDGVTSGQYDFFGVVAHEFSEVMGRILLVGGKIGTTTNSYDPLDLFHFSAPGTHDLSGTTPGYFSVDNGTTNLHNFNVSPLGGDRGDWASSATVDAFDAFGTSGVIEPISASDITALDVIGWDAGLSSPPPAAPDLTVSGLALAPTGTAIDFQITNIGTANDTVTSTASVYLSTDSTITTSDTWLATVSTSALGVGASDLEHVLLTLTAPANAGTYYLGVIADSSNAVTELNEFNNTATLPVILGNNSGNSLTGTSGSDIIMGFGGNDTITGGAGSDLLIGGDGADHFRYTSKTDGGGVGDLIVDFTHGSDELDFSRFAFGNHLATGGTNLGTLDSSHFVSNSDGHATAATAQFVYNTSNGTLSFDSDGTGATAAITMAQLENHAPLTFSDIHLV